MPSLSVGPLLAAHCPQRWSQGQILTSHEVQRPLPTLHLTSYHSPPITSPASPEPLRDPLLILAPRPWPVQATPPNRSVLWFSHHSCLGPSHLLGEPIPDSWNTGVAPPQPVLTQCASEHTSPLEPARLLTCLSRKARRVLQSRLCLTDPPSTKRRTRHVADAQ